MRKSKPKKRYFLPDPIYKDTLVTQFVNNLMHDGKKSLSYTIFYDSFKIVEDITKEKGLDIWKKALNNVMPSVEVKSRRVGGANFQVPIEVRPNRKITLSQKWLIKYARLRKENSLTLWNKKKLIKNTIKIKLNILTKTKTIKPTIKRKKIRSNFNTY